MLDVGRARDQRHDLFTRQNLRQLLGLSRARDCKLGLGTLERDAIKELEALCHDVAT